jgi:hypothetical protein
VIRLLERSIDPGRGAQAASTISGEGDHQSRFMPCPIALGV